MKTIISGDPGAVAMRHRIIIDCDPGIDDALAIFLALASDELDVVGLTCVAGNVGLNHVMRNALDIVNIAGNGAWVPVCRGAESASVLPAEDASRVHGKNGIGNVRIPRSGFHEYERSAVDFIWETAQALNGELEIAAIAPLTNLGAALQVYPDLKRLVKRIVMMGGSAGSGNATPAAEFNIFTDPHAAAVVFESGIPIDMYGLDVTRRAVISEDERKILATECGKVGEYCAEMLEHYADFYESMGRKVLSLHDPCAMVGLINENLMQLHDCNVRVETEDSLTLGKTAVDVRQPFRESANARVALELDNSGFIELFLNRMRRYACR